MLQVTTRLEKSSIHGIGVFANERIPTGTVIWEFQPNFDVIVPLKKALRLPQTGLAFLARYAEYFEEDQEFRLSGDDDRFMNHSNTPNTRDAGKKVYASNNIAKGEELTCDYNDVFIVEYHFGHFSNWVGTLDRAV